MSIRQIAYCTDFSANSEAAFLASLDLTKRYKAKLIIIHVLPPIFNPMLMDTELVHVSKSDNSLITELEGRMAQNFSERIDADIEHELVILEGHISSEIITYLENNPIDLVVMGAYGFTGMGLVLFGSVAKRISHKAPCSVIIVRERAQ